MMAAPKQNFTYDVFISFSEKDYEVAKSTGEELAAHGLRCFLFTKELKSKIGTSFIQAVYEALENSQHFLLIGTTQTFTSKWVREEYETFYNEFLYPQISKEGS